ncbi:MAG: DNA repair protein RecO [bacterium]|nr:DNA repair protein RecO [bacterium]
MRFFSDQAVVLKKHSVGEKDELVILLSKVHGRLAAMAKGSRDPKSRKAGALQLFNTIAFQARESRAGSPYLQQVKLLTSRGFGIVEGGGELEKYYRAAQIVRFTLDHVHEGQEAARVFADLNEALDLIAFPLIDLIYQVRLLSDLGFLPDWSRCSTTHRKLDLNQPLGFSEENKGFSGQQAFRGGIKVNAELVKVLSFFQRGAVQRSVKVQVSSGLEERARGILQKITIH